MPGGPGDSLFWGVASVTPQCTEIHGEVIHKEDSILYVVVNLSEELGGETYEEGHKIYVSPEVYDNYEVGENYSEVVCDIERLMEIREFLDYMLDEGISLPHFWIPTISGP